MVVISDGADRDGNTLVSENNVAFLVQNGLKGEGTFRVDAITSLQKDIGPFNDQSSSIIGIFYCGILHLRHVKVGHQRCNVLRGSQPRVNIFTRVQKASSGNGDVLDIMTVEGKLEF